MAATREDRSSLAGGCTMLGVAKPSSIKEAHSFTSPNSFLLFGVKTRVMCRNASASLSRLYGSTEKRYFLICSEVGVHNVQMVMVQPSMPPHSPAGAQLIGRCMTAVLRI